MSWEWACQCKHERGTLFEGYKTNLTDGFLVRVVQVTLQLYDPALSSTDKALGCSAADCKTASYGQQPVCTSNSACGYSVEYADGSSTAGYLINDMLTFQQVENSTTTNATANVYFGLVAQT